MEKYKDETRELKWKNKSIINLYKFVKSNWPNFNFDINLKKNKNKIKNSKEE